MLLHEVFQKSEVVRNPQIIFKIKKQRSVADATAGFAEGKTATRCASDRRERARAVSKTEGLATRASALSAVFKSVQCSSPET